MPFEERTGLGDVGPLRKTVAPPRVVFRDRMELWEIKSNRAYAFRCHLIVGVLLNKECLFLRSIRYGRNESAHSFETPQDFGYCDFCRGASALDNHRFGMVPQESCIRHVAVEVAVEAEQDHRWNLEGIGEEI